MTSPSASRSLVLGLLTALAACGGKNSSSTGPVGNDGSGGDEKAAATPFDLDAVQATLAAMPVPDACGGPEAAANLGEHLDNNRELLGESDTEVTFDCRPADGEPWDCDWSVLTKASGVVDPDDPGAGEGGSGYQILFKVDDSGTIAPDSVACNAPG